MMNNVPNDVDIMWDYILYVITEVADIHCPLKRMKIRKKMSSFDGERDNRRNLSKQNSL